MIAILEFKDGEVDGWILARDYLDAARQAHDIGRHDLAAVLYEIGPYGPGPGRHSLRTGHLLLVS